jgi:hypothetical protein
MVFVIMVDIAKEVDQNLEKYVNLIGFLLWFLSILVSINDLYN